MGKPAEVPQRTLKIQMELEVPARIGNDMELVRGRLQSFRPSDFGSKPLFDASVHLLQNPGKGLRAALVLSSASALNLEPISGFIDLAVAVELQHTASLVIDDIIDKDSVRRGVPAVHEHFSREMAELASHALVAKAIELATKYAPEVVRRAAQAAMDMNDGEQRDLDMQRSGVQPTLDDYMEMIKRKTASLIAVALSAPAVHAGNQQLADVLHEIGMSMGCSFQIRDDILEFQGMKERKSSNSESERMTRPNIARVFEAHGRPDPLATAVKFNNFFVSRARELLSRIPDSSLFEGYLAFLEINE